MKLTESRPHEVVYLDAPWPRTPCGTAVTPYPTMRWADLHAFDLGSWLAKDAVVFAWTTGPTHLKEAAVFSTWCKRFGLYEAGIAYIWVKTRAGSMKDVRRYSFLLQQAGNDLLTPNERVRAAFDACELERRMSAPIGAAGPRPKLVKQLGEFVMAFTTRKRGRVFPLLTESQSQWVFAPKPKRGEHSRKPAVVRERIVELLGDRPRVELFARDAVPGWNRWGFDAPQDG